MAGIVQHWPRLELPAELKRYVSYYRTPDKPGVEYHAYPVDLVRTTFTGEQDVLSANFQASGWRTHVFAISFSGDISWWNIELIKSNADRLIEPQPVAVLLNAPTLSRALGSPGDAYPLGLLIPNPGALLWDPPIVLEGTDTLKFNGSVSDLVVPNQDNRTVLHIGVHCWEFPDAPRWAGGGPERKEA